MREFLKGQFKISKILSKLTAVFIITLAFLFDTSIFAQTAPPQKVDLSLSPSSQNVTANQSFNIDVLVDGKSNKVSAVFLEIKFDPEFLELQNATPQDYLPAVLMPTNIDNIGGKVELVLGAQPGQADGGQGKLASLQFKAKKKTSSPAKIIISPNSAVTVIGQNSNFLGPLQDSSVVIDSETVVSKSASFELVSERASVGVGEEFKVVIRANSNQDEANLFSALINFDPSLFEITKVDTQGSFISQWATTSFDNSLGTAKIIGGVPDPGFKTPDLGSDMATVFFKAKKAGLGLIDLDNQSVIYRNSDNNDILQTKTPLTIQVVSNPSPTPTPTPIPSPTPSPTVSPSPIVATPTPTATPNNTSCSILAASWSKTDSSEGKVVNLNILGSDNCNGKQVNIKVREDDGPLGSQDVINNPAVATFDGISASTSWISEYQVDGYLGVWDPPEYFFNAQITGDAVVFKSTNKLTVTKLLIGQSQKGDGDYDGVVNLKDLSILFSYWNKEGSFPFTLDLNDDGLINSFDFSGLINLLKTKNFL